MKEHFCNDRCHGHEGSALSRRRVEQECYAYALDVTRLLPLSRHRCGWWCSEPDLGGPIRLGRAGEPVSYELGLSPQAAKLLARLRSSR